MQHGSRQLKDWQRRQGLNQREAAVKIGVHFTTYNQFLTGRRAPGRELAVSIQRLTGIPVEAWTPTKVGKAKKAPVSIGGNRQYLHGENSHAR